jgi:hypothetical protein
VVRRPSGCLGIDTAEPKLRKIKSTNQRRRPDVTLR